MYFIEKLSEILPVTLISFNIVAFQRRYADLLTIAQHIKSLYEQAADTGTDGNVNGAELMAREDFLDHLDALLYACRDAQFSALYNEYKVRWVYLAMLQKLGYYVKMNPGIQHKAGVTVGGTFILVYHERSRVRQPNVNIFTNRITATVATNRIDDVTLANRADEVKPAPQKSAPKSKKSAGTEEAAPQEATKQAGPDSAAKADSGGQSAGANISSAAYASVHQLQTSKLKASLTQKQFAIIDKLFFKDLITRHSLDELTAQLPDRIVIADFYLPYMCCSDCPPVYYIVNETAEDEPDQPAVSIKDTQYCGADKTAYPITATPAGGSFGNSEGVSDTNGVFTFNPSAVAIPEGSLNKIIALTYTKDGLSASVNVTVFAKPQAAFDVIPATSYNFFVFANKSLMAESVTWDFGDSITAAGDNPSHTYAQDGIYTVTLKAVNGPCSDTASRTITVARATVAIDGREFCSIDNGAYPIIVNPDGGNVTGEGTAKDAAGFVFRPAAVAFAATEGSKDIIISYSLPGQVVQTSVKVFRTPSAAFTVSVGTAAPNLRGFKTANTFPAQYNWDFGDGEKSVEPAPNHQYKQGGVFTVTLSVANGKCTSTSSQQVTIGVDNPPPEKTCGPLNDVLASFKGLNKINANLFKIFTSIYEPYAEIKDYFDKLAEVSGQSIGKQLDFFAESEIAALLDKWFTTLNPLVMNSDVRVIAIAMWRVLTDLAMYVMCIQDGDFDKNRINLGALFNKIEGFIKGWTPLAPNFSKDDKAQVQLILNDMAAERERATKNGEDNVKKTYLGKLDSCIKMLMVYVK
jgi:PKD repeat protein